VALNSTKLVGVTSAVLGILTNPVQADGARDLFPESAATPPSNLIRTRTERFVGDYAEVRSEILNMISGAGRRVWISSEMLSDSDIAAALLVAQFRRLDVQVMIGPKGNSEPLSRVPNLVQQGINAFVRPRNLAMRFQTAIITDERMVWVDASLDPYVMRGMVAVEPAGDQERMAHEQAFGVPADNKVRASSKVSNKRVGRQRNVAVIDAAPAQPATSTKYVPSNVGEIKTETIGGVYNYNRTRHDRKPPDGISAKLPGMTIRQRRDRDDVKPSGNFNGQGVQPPSENREVNDEQFVVVAQVCCWSDVGRCSWLHQELR